MAQQGKAEDFLPREFLDSEVIGSLEKTYEKHEVEWKVLDIVSEDKNIKVFVSRYVYFLHSEWRMLLFGRFFGDSEPGSAGVSESLYLVLLRHEQRSCPMRSTSCCPVKFTLRWKKLDGTVEQIVSGVMNSGHDRSEYTTINIPEIRRLQSQFAPSDPYYLTFILKLESFNMSTLDEPKHKKLKKLATLSENFKDLFTNKIGCDTSLSVEGKIFETHKDVLIARSSVFAAMFQNRTPENESGEVFIADCDPNTFEEFLKFLYCGEMEELSPSRAISMYKTAERYDVQEIKAFCRDLLKKNFSVKNFCDFVSLAHKYKDEELMSAAQGFFKLKMKAIFLSPEWARLMKDNFRLCSKLLKQLPRFTATE